MVAAVSHIQTSADVQKWGSFCAAPHLCQLCLPPELRPYWVHGRRLHHEPADGHRHLRHPVQGAGPGVPVGYVWGPPPQPHVWMSARIAAVSSHVICSTGLGCLCDSMQLCLVSLSEQPALQSMKTAGWYEADWQRIRGSVTPFALLQVSWDGDVIQPADRLRGPQSADGCCYLDLHNS